MKNYFIEIDNKSSILWVYNDADKSISKVPSFNYDNHVKMRDLLEDLDEILSTALHNGHHDLIERVKEILK